MDEFPYNPQDEKSTLNPLPVAGYTKQSPAAVREVNKHKETEEKILRQLDIYTGLPEVDQRWLAIARTHIEEGFMALNRSIFRPQRLTFDE